jgi:uncharacterized membrane protein YjjP (DUF1212 family)
MQAEAQIAKTTLDYDALMDLVLRIGFELIDSGAETYRVEESLLRILSCYGLKEIDIFAVANYLLVSFVNPDGKTFSRGKRILARHENLNRLGKLNQLSREICLETPEISDARQQLEEIAQLTGYSLIVRLFAAAVVGFAFCLMFGGSIQAGALAGAASVIVRLSIEPQIRLHVNGIFINIFGGAIGALLSLWIMQLGWSTEMDRIMIGIYMNLVPGLALTNSLRDIIAGDYLSGLTKLTEALLIASAIAIGSGMVFSLMR